MVLKYLNKFSGALIAPILYSFKALLFGLILFVSTLICLFAIIGDMLYNYAKSNPFNLDWPARSLSTITLAVVATSMLIIAAGIFAIFLGVVFIVGLIIAIPYGFKDGYRQGLFFNVLKRFFSAENTVEQLLVEELYVEVLYEEELDVEELYEHLPANKEVFIPLTQDELTLANHTPDLTAVVAGYTGLMERLVKLDDAISKRGNNPEMELDDEIIEDECIPFCAINKPVLVVKQYQTPDDQWKPVPVGSHITDDGNIKKCLREKNSHPRTREQMDKANPYEGRPTRYRLHLYQNQSSSQELVQSALIIRDKLQRVNPNPVQAVKPQPSFFQQQPSAKGNPLKQSSQPFELSSDPTQ